MASCHVQELLEARKKAKGLKAMPNYLAKITVELEAELEFTGETLEEATDWLENYAKFDDLKKLGGYWPTEKIIVRSIVDNVGE